MRLSKVMLVAGAAAASLGCSEFHPCVFIAPGAPWLALSSHEPGSWDVQVLRADGTCRQTVGADPAGNFNPAWAPRGIVGYESDRAPFTSIWIHDFARGTEGRLDVGDLRATSPAFSPGGSLVAFEGRAPSATTSDVYLVSVQGGTPVNLTNDTHGNGGPAFSPDGATVYFVSNRGGTYEVYRVPAAGGAAVQVTTASGIVGKPAVSPDGAKLAFARIAGASTEVVLYDLGTDQTTPIAGTTGMSEPAFDPAGGRLAVTLAGLATAHIAFVPLAGSAAVQLTDGPGPDGAAAFAPIER